MNRFVPLVLVTLLALPVSGCGGLEPFVDEFRTGTERMVDVKQMTTDLIDVCYNAGYTTPARIWELAREECALRGNRTPRYIGQFQYQCRLLIPTRARFRCVESGEQGG